MSQITTPITKSFYGQIYLITNTLNGKAYVGQTIKPLEERLQEHLYHAMREKDKLGLYRAIRKYGRENFSIKPIGQALDKKSLDILEIYYIAFYRDLLGEKYVYNIAAGGLGNAGCLKGRKRGPMSEEQKQLRRKPHLEETKIKMSLAHKNHKLDCKCISCRSRRGEYIPSTETKEKLRAAKIKRDKLIPNSNLGVYNTSRSIPVIQLTLSGEFIKEWPSISEVKRTLGFCVSAIFPCVSGRNKTSYGFKWVRKSDYVGVING